MNQFGDLLFKVAFEMPHAVFYDFLIHYLIFECAIGMVANIWLDPWGAVMFTYIPLDYNVWFYERSHLYYDMTWRTWHERTWTGKIQKNIGCPDRDFKLFDKEYFEFINKPWNEEYRWELLMVNDGPEIFTHFKAIYPRIWQIIGAYGVIFEVVYQDDMQPYNIEYIYPKSLNNQYDLKTYESKSGFFFPKTQFATGLKEEPKFISNNEFFEIQGERFNVTNRLKLIERYNNPYGSLKTADKISLESKNDFKDKNYDFSKHVSYTDMQMDFGRISKKWKDTFAEFYKEYENL